jgi:hypothetical protein
LRKDVDDRLPRRPRRRMNGVGTISPPDLVQTFDNEKLVDALY